VSDARGPAQGRPDGEADPSVRGRRSEQSNTVSDARGPGADPPAGGRAEGGRPAGDAVAGGTFGAVRERLARLSLRARIGILAALAVGLAVATTSVVAFLTVRMQLYERLDTNLLERAEAAVDSPLAEPDQLARIPAEVLGAADVRIASMQADGSARSALGEVSAPPLGEAEIAVARGMLPRSIRTATLDGITYRVVAVPTGTGSALVLAQSTAATEKSLAQLGLVLFLVGVAGIAAAATGGVAIARAGLRPVERLTAAAERVAQTEELVPIEVPAAGSRGNDELARLAVSFNAMLVALARSRDRQQQLVADAGHELRTPLTSLRTNLDLLAQSLAAGERGLPPAERDALLADVRAQVEELSGLVQDLVELARDDPPAAAAQPLDLVPVVERAVDRVRRRAPGLDFDTRVESWWVRGDATALDRAVTNLLDNAAKWSPAGGTVTVTLSGGVLRVADQGPGIAPADLPYVFERFYRASSARTLPGSGLGLAIVRQAVQRHGGTVTAEPAPGGGTLVTLWLPPAADPAAEVVADPATERRTGWSSPGPPPPGAPPGPPAAGGRAAPGGGQQRGTWGVPVRGRPRRGTGFFASS
jgi:two-component system, OmpR family, sensor histidine kinase MprB